MPTSKHRKNRRAYKPEARRTPIILRHALADERQLMLVPHQELEKLRRGLATEESWHTLAFRINVGQAIAVSLCDVAVREELSDAVLAISEVGRRYQEKGTLGLSGDQFRAIARGLNITDELQEATTRREQLAASHLVMEIAPTVPAGDVYQMRLADTGVRRRITC